MVAFADAQMLELAMARVPTVVAYRVNALTAAVMAPMIKVRYVAMTNILVDRPALPELLQGAVTPENLAVAVGELLSDPVRRARMQADQAAALAMLGLGQALPGRRAAEAVLDIAGLTRRSTASKQPAPPEPADAQRRMPAP